MPPPYSAAILLGASEFPDYPAFAPSRQFKSTHDSVLAYFTGPHGLAIPTDRVLNLFNSELSPAAHSKAVRNFLRLIDESSAEEKQRNLFVHYVGHGLLFDKEYLVAIRTIQQMDEVESCIRMKSLGKVLHEFRGFRKFAILDCCYAAATAKEWMAPGALAIPQAAANAFPGDEAPEGELAPISEITQGTALLCAADQFEVAYSPAGMDYTLFGDALLKVLSQGSKTAGRMLTLEQIEQLAWQHMKRLPVGHSGVSTVVKPVVHCPDQPQGNPAKIGIFPNLGFKSSASKPPTPRRPLASQFPQSEADRIDRFVKFVRAHALLASSGAVVLGIGVGMGVAMSNRPVPPPPPAAPPTTPAPPTAPAPVAPVVAAAPPPLSPIAPQTSIASANALGNREFWVFLGQAEDDTLVTGSFGLQILPSVGQELQAKGATNARDREPLYENGKWSMGQIVGGLRAGDKVIVKSVYKINKNDPRMVWARVVLVQ